MRKTGGGTLPDDVVPHLSKQDLLSLQYQGFVTAAGNQLFISLEFPYEHLQAAK